MGAYNVHSPVTGQPDLQADRRSDIQEKGWARPKDTRVESGADVNAFVKRE